MLDKILLQKMLDEKYVSVQKHPEADLFIYNYTKKTQYENIWNSITNITRGLILDKDMNVVSRSFDKFRNIQEHEPFEIPKLPFIVTEKMDGSCGISYWLNGVPNIATRGSFTSEQAIHATKLLNNKYKHVFGRMRQDLTYIWEIIYPENKICCDYLWLNDIVLLAIRETKTGKFLPLEDIGFPLVKIYDGINDVEPLKLLDETNKEGFVIRFLNDFMCKIKFENYVKLHKIVTNTSNIVIWEYLSENKPINELIDNTPDEWFDYVKQTIQDLISKYSYIEIRARKIYDVIYEPGMFQKEFALKAIEYEPHIKAILFSMYNGKDYSKTIWKKIRPKFSKPFSNSIEQEI